MTAKPHTFTATLATLTMYVIVGCSTVDGTLTPPGDPDGGGGQGGGGTQVTPDAGRDGGSGGDGTGGRDVDVGDGGAPDAGGLGKCAEEDEVGEPARCERPHADGYCYEGYCYVTDCHAGYRDCNLDPADGCEAGPDDVDNCGACGRACSRPGSAFACLDNSCAYLGCAEGFADCDASEANGCEVDITSATHCGACGNSCPTPPMGAPACIDGTCGVGECLPGFGDCDGVADNGCEQRLDSDAHCGGCNRACMPANGSGTCEGGTCVVQACDAGHYDCNGSGADGCETDLHDGDNCGGCGLACELPSVLDYACPEATCLLDDSCPGAIPGCTPGTPGAGCTPGFADCNADPADGCEADITRVSECGACGNDCRAPNTISACDDGQCYITGCDAGFGQCTAGGPCLSLTDDAANCGGCGIECGAGEQCIGGACSDLVCPPDTADCDDQVAGCETSLTTTDNCGGCGIACGPYAHADGACESRRCELSQCDPGYLDCDTTVGTGCEADAASTATCGSCDNDCGRLPGVQGADCDGGTCLITACAPLRADCNADPDDGCESNLALPASCGACANDCSKLPNTRSQGCNAGECDFSCAPGFADCNGEAADGCETDLQTLSDCGSCGNDCSGLQHVAAAQCIDGACADVTCEDGYGDCDALAFTGCEQSTRGPQNCGGCGLLCAPPGATASACPDGTCQYSCDGPLKDCNSDPVDGCEADIASDADNCGGCGIECDGICTDGVCGCATDDHCGPGEGCCDGLCVFTDSSCVWWPCIPGFSMPRTNCGGCGDTCVQLACCRN